jgi:hypothetical protein
MPLLIDAPAVARREVGVVAVTGPDRVSYLNSLLSQQFDGARPGSARDFLYLDAKGNARAMGRALVLEDRVLLVTPARELAATLATALQTYRFLLQVEAEDAGERDALSSARGPTRIEIAGAPETVMTVAADGEGLLVRDRSGGVDLLGPPEWLAARIQRSGLPMASAAEWEAWRIGAGEPAWTAEVVAGRRAQELGLLPTHVHLRKGCYPGQESIAKIYNLGRPRRALAVVEFDGPVSAGDVLEASGKRGEITSAAPAGSRWLALALLPLDPQGQLHAGVRVSVGATGTISGTVRRRVGEGLPQPGAEPVHART